MLLLVAISAGMVGGSDDGAIVGLLRRSHPRPAGADAARALGPGLLRHRLRRRPGPGRGRPVDPAGRHRRWPSRPASLGVGLYVRRVAGRRPLRAVQPPPPRDHRWWSPAVNAVLIGPVNRAMRWALGEPCEQPGPRSVERRPRAGLDAAMDPDSPASGSASWRSWCSRCSRAVRPPLVPAGHDVRPARPRPRQPRAHGHPRRRRAAASSTPRAGCWSTTAVTGRHHRSLRPDHLTPSQAKATEAARGHPAHRLGRAHQGGRRSSTASPTRSTTRCSRSRWPWMCPRTSMLYFAERADDYPASTVQRETVRQYPYGRWPPTCSVTSGASPRTSRREAGHDQTPRARRSPTRPTAASARAASRRSTRTTCGGSPASRRSRSTQRAR